MYPTNTMKIVGAVSFSMMGLTLKQHWLNALCKWLLGTSKKRISPMNCLSRFSRRQRMEAEYYKDIITWLYLHRYRSRDTDRLHDDVLPRVFWAGDRLHRISTDLWKYDAVLPANTRHSPNTVPMLGQRRRRWPTLKQHWLNALCSLALIGKRSESPGPRLCVALCLLGVVTALRPNARAVHTRTLPVGPATANVAQPAHA